MRKSTSLVASVVVLLIAASAAPGARATTLARLSLEQMARAADTVVRARCVSVESRWDGGAIWTFTRFDVIETLKGAPPERIVVRLPGGTCRAPGDQHRSGTAISARRGRLSFSGKNARGRLCGDRLGRRHFPREAGWSWKRCHGDSGLDRPSRVRRRNAKLPQRGRTAPSGGAIPRTARGGAGCGSRRRKTMSGAMRNTARKRVKDRRNRGRARMTRRAAIGLTWLLLAHAVAAPPVAAYGLNYVVADMRQPAAQSGPTACPQRMRLNVNISGGINRQWSTSLGTNPTTILTANQTPAGQLNEIEATISEALGAWSGVAGSALTPNALAPLGADCGTERLRGRRSQYHLPQSIRSGFRDGGAGLYARSSRRHHR